MMISNLVSHMVGDDQIKNLIYETLQIFPKQIVDYISDNVWFVSSFNDAWSFTLEADDLCGKAIVFLSDDLLRQDREQIKYSVAHEIAHVMLGHKNPYDSRPIKNQEKKYETSADEFAKYYLELSKQV